MPPTPKAPNKPAVWELVKTKLRGSSEGGPPGTWTPRKSVLAQLEYRRRGGGWKKTTEGA